MTEMQACTINQRWTLQLPTHRAIRPGWSAWERANLHAMWCATRPGDLVWDIGAEEGDMSCAYATWGARVVLVEPSPQAWPWIMATFDANGVEPEACCVALAAKEGNGAEVLRGIYPDVAAGEFVPEHAFRHLDEALDAAPRVSLDDLASAVGDPDVVTIDVEGSEYQVLLGAEALLSRRHAQFAISVHPEFLRQRWGDTPDDVIAHMELAGYEVHYLGMDHEAHYFCRPLA